MNSSQLILPSIYGALPSFSGAAPIIWGAATDTTGKAGTVVTALNSGPTSPVITGGGVGGTSVYNFAASNYTAVTFPPTGGDGGGAILGTGEGDNYGQFAVGTFVAEADTQGLVLAPGGAGFGNSHFNAILVVEGSGVEAEATITDITFDPSTNEVSLTWTSNPGTFYALLWSLDLNDFAADIDDSLSASAGETTTHVFTLPAELIGQPNVFFRVEPGA